MKDPTSIKVIDGKVKTTLRLPEDLYWKVQATKAERKIPSDEAAYRSAVESWVGPESAKRPESTIEELARLHPKAHIMVRPGDSGLEYEVIDDPRRIRELEEADEPVHSEFTIGVSEAQQKLLSRSAAVLRRENDFQLKDFERYLGALLDAHRTPNATSSAPNPLVEVFTRLMASDDRAAKEQILPYLKHWESQHPSPPKETADAKPTQEAARRSDKRKLHA